MRFIRHALELLTYRLSLPFLFRQNQVVVEFLEADTLEDTSRVIGQPITHKYLKKGYYSALHN